MKTRYKAALALTALAVPTAIYAVLVPGTGLEITGDPGNDGNYVGPSSGVYGPYNYASSKSVSIGQYNHASSMSVGIGQHNDLWDSALAVGYDNECDNMSLAVGIWNFVNTAGGQTPRGAFALGQGNTIEAYSSIAAGNANAQTGDNSAIIGEGLTNNSDSAVVVGSYNVDKPDVRFVVGNGTKDGSNPKEPANALEVHADGSVIINNRQGDVLMGSFGYANGN